MNDKYAPLPGCQCAVCLWARRRAAAEQAKQDDLEANYARYQAGELVAKDERE